MPTAVLAQHSHRLDAERKATGQAQYVADVTLPGLAHAAMVRSTMAHAVITGVDVSAALACDGVIGVFTAADVSPALYGRALADTPILARDKVRFVGERVAAVVAETREQAEIAAALVEVDYEPLPAVTDAAGALAPDAPAVHDRPWTYHGATTTPGAPPNVIRRVEHGSLADAERALATAAYQVDRTYRTQGVHQGYLEPQACIADYRSPELVRLWITNKSPYRLREILAQCLAIPASSFDIQSVALGGDFGGKGSPQDAPICIELSRLTGRPVKSVLRYAEDLISTNPRHPAEIRVRLGCDRQGRLVAAATHAYADAGAYGGFTPNSAGPHGLTDAPCYRIPVFAAEAVRLYTNTVPRGHMRAPGSPQAVFAFESAMDELAHLAGVEPAELRRRNLLRDGEPDGEQRRWAEHRGHATLDAALAAVRPIEPPPGWLYGRGLAMYSRPTATQGRTSMRLTPLPDGGLLVQTALIETGTGSHTALRELLSAQLAIPRERIEVVGVATDELPYDAGAGGSRVTASLAALVDAAAESWATRSGDEPLVVEFDGKIGPEVGSYVAHVAQVAVDPETGQLRVLELLSAVDVAAIINPAAHQMQVDGGVVMGYGFACLEDLNEAEGQVWAANLGEFKLPSARDVPPLRTVRVPGGLGVGTANVKNVGETTTPAVAAAIANAVFDATRGRLRELPLTAERIHRAMKGR